MNNQQHLFRIAGHVVGICFSPSESNNINLLPSFEPFRIEKTDVPPLLTLHVDDSLRPVKDGQLIRTFDTGNGDTVVYQLPDGGYQFIIRDIRNRDCSLLITNADFTESRCALNGDYNMRAFGLNDAMMLVYAFAGSYHKTMLIHASCIMVGDTAYPFIAHRTHRRRYTLYIWITLEWQDAMLQEYTSPAGRNGTNSTSPRK